MSYTQEHGFDTDIGIRPLKFTVNYATDISAYTFTIYGQNESDGTEDSWTGTASFASSVLTIQATPDAVMSDGQWVFHITAVNTTNQFSIGPFPNDTDRIEIKNNNFV